MAPEIRVIGKIVLNEDQRKRLQRLGVSEIAKDNPGSRSDEDEIVRRIGNASAIVINISTPVTASVIQRCPKLQFIQTWSTGLDNVDLDAARAAGIEVSNVPDFSTEAVAEKAIGLMILAANHWVEAAQSVQEGRWEYTRFRGIELKGKNLAILGYGKIGKRVDELASAFGMNRFGIRSSTSRSELEEILKKADFISLHCPYRESTHHLLSEEEFSLLKKNVILINCSRGGVVNENDLLNALDSGKVGFAVIDVFEKEPPLKDHPLLTHPRTFVTPHCAWNTEESVQRLTDVTIDRLESFVLKGKP